MLVGSLLSDMISVKDMKDVFICHASEDEAEVVRPLTRALGAASLSYWCDHNDIIWGDKLPEKINEGLRTSHYVMVLLSRASMSKNWPRFELNAALSIEASSGEVRVLPLVIGSKAEIAAILAELPILNDKVYMTWCGDAQQVVEELKRRLGRASPAQQDNIRPTAVPGFDIPVPVIRRRSFTDREKDLETISKR